MWVYLFSVRLSVYTSLCRAHSVGAADYRAENAERILFCHSHRSFQAVLFGMSILYIGFMYLSNP